MKEFAFSLVPHQPLEAYHMSVTNVIQKRVVGTRIERIKLVDST